MANPLHQMPRKKERTLAWRSQSSQKPVPSPIEGFNRCAPFQIVEDFSYRQILPRQRFSGFFKIAGIDDVLRFGQRFFQRAFLGDQIEHRLYAF